MALCLALSRAIDNVNVVVNEISVDSENPTHNENPFNVYKLASHLLSSMMTDLQTPLALTFGIRYSGGVLVSSENSKTSTCTRSTREIVTWGVKTTSLVTYSGLSRKRNPNITGILY